MDDVEARNLTRALQSLDRSIKAHGEKIKDLFRVAEALNRNLVEIGRMMKLKDEVKDVQDVSSEGL